MHAVALRISVDHPGQLKDVGGAFGQQFLGPLLEQGQTPVVLSYGPCTSGKSLLTRAAVETLPQQYAQYAGDILRPAEDYARENRAAENPLMRYHDFGPATASYGNEPYIMQNELRLVPRVDMIRIDKRFQAGFDLLEHATIPHLNNADVVLLLRQASYPEHERNTARAYFGHMVRGIANDDVKPDDALKWKYHCTNPRIGNVIQEMCRLRDEPVVGRPTSDHLARAGVIMLTSQRPEFRQAFGDFVTQAMKLRS